MGLNELWFLLIAVLFVGFFFLEGFDFGVGMSTRFLAKNDLERRIMIKTRSDLSGMPMKCGC